LTWKEIFFPVALSVVVVGALSAVFGQRRGKNESAVAGKSLVACLIVTG
jgi:hypothetical protein